MCEVRQTITEFLSRQAPGLTIGEDDDLLTTGLLDSMGVFGLVVNIEKRFQLKIDTGRLTEENFHSIRAIAGMVERLMSTGHAS